MNAGFTILIGNQSLAMSTSSSHSPSASPPLMRDDDGSDMGNGGWSWEEDDVLYRFDAIYGGVGLSDLTCQPRPSIPISAIHMSWIWGHRSTQAFGLRIGVRLDSNFITRQ